MSYLVLFSTYFQSKQVKPQVEATAAGKATVPATMVVLWFHELAEHQLFQTFTVLRETNW